MLTFITAVCSVQPHLAAYRRASISLSDTLRLYSSAPKRNTRTASISTNIDEVSKMSAPAAISHGCRLPAALRMSRGIGEVSGKRLKNRTIGASGIEINSDTA